MREVVGVYKDLSDEECERMIAEAHENKWRDITSLRGSASISDAKIDVAMIMIAKNRSPDFIKYVTGFTYEEIDELRDKASERTKDASLADMEATFAEQAALIAELQAQLASNK